MQNPSATATMSSVRTPGSVTGPRIDAAASRGPPPTDRVSGSAPNAAVTAPQPSPVATSAASGVATVAAVTSTSGPTRKASSCSEASSVTIRPNAAASSIRPQTTRDEAETGGSARPQVSATAA